eukprot:scaffold16017_cov63-Phaeocystis_antarctica.AAC.3
MACANTQVACANMQICTRPPHRAKERSLRSQSSSFGRSSDENVASVAKCVASSQMPAKVTCE